MSNVTKEQKVAAFQVLTAVCETVRELKRVPSGHLYARLMDRMDLEAFNKMVAMLKNTGLVIEQNNELIWNGPVI